MAVYKFRIELEDFEASRDVEMLSRQTVATLFEGAMAAFGFDTGLLAILYDSDLYWRKGREIATNDLDLADKRGWKMMDEVRIAEPINDPHQRFVLVYDKAKRWTFNIELMGIELNETDATYPRTVRKMGDAPKQYAEQNLIAVNDEFSGHTGIEEGVEQEDLAFLEGEEGEESSGADEPSFGPMPEE